MTNLAKSARKPALPKTASFTSGAVHRRKSRATIWSATSFFERPRPECRAQGGHGARRAATARRSTRWSSIAAFPCVPKMARRTLGLGADMQPTVTGGLTFFGAPLKHLHDACGLRDGAENCVAAPGSGLLLRPGRLRQPNIMRWCCHVRRPQGPLAQDTSVQARGGQPSRGPRLTSSPKPAARGSGRKALPLSMAATARSSNGVGDAADTGPRPARWRGCPRATGRTLAHLTSMDRTPVGVVRRYRYLRMMACWSGDTCSSRHTRHRVSPSASPMTGSSGYPVIAGA